MQPTLYSGDNLIVEKISYRFNEPKRFDIIVFPYQYAKKTYYIKRVIGLPGETVRIDEEGNIYINDEILEEHYGKEVILSPGLAKDTITLGGMNTLLWVIIEMTVQTVVIQKCGEYKAEGYYRKSIYQNMVIFQVW